VIAFSVEEDDRCMLTTHPAKLKSRSHGTEQTLQFITLS